VTATAVTINMPGVTTGTQVQAAGFRIIKLGQQSLLSIPANAGNAAGVNPVNMFNLVGNVDRVRNDPIVTLGPKNVLVARMATAIASLPDTVGISMHGKLH
jgi:hypothetical protein